VGDALARAAALLADLRPIVALTGAGISVDSGIPDFRSPGGLWSRFPPAAYATLDAFHARPEKVWEMVHALEVELARARPNPGHQALAALEAAGILGAVITQNVDGLHQAAGSREVIEFHGTGARRVCLRCDVRTPAAPDPARRPPRCARCGAILKPDVVFFGEPIPAAALRDAFAWAGRARAVLVCGTSATVSPAAEVPLLARQAGAVLCEFNLEETPLSRHAHVLVRGSTSDTLPALAARLGA
jgi:NAD-dependent deacetylase